MPAVHIRGSKIGDVTTGSPGADRHRIASHFLASHQSVKVVDYGHLVISPGLIDVHVHLDEPGREHWEGKGLAAWPGYSYKQGRCGRRLGGIRFLVRGYISRHCA